MKSKIVLLALSGAVLAACGGGGGGGGDGTAPSLFNPESVLSPQVPTNQLQEDTQPTGEKYICRNRRLGKVRIDNLEVPAGANCALVGTELIGSIEVKPGGFLELSDVQLNGNLIGDRSARIQTASGITGIGGSVQIKEGIEVTLRNAQITGNIQLEKNTGNLTVEGNNLGGNIQLVGNTGMYTVLGNTVRQNLEVKENRFRGNYGTPLVQNNRINGKLTCTQNDPIPRASGNVPDGGFDGDCRA